MREDESGYFNKKRVKIRPRPKRNLRLFAGTSTLFYKIFKFLFFEKRFFKRAITIKRLPWKYKIKVDISKENGRQRGYCRIKKKVICLSSRFRTAQQTTLDAALCITGIFKNPKTNAYVNSIRFV